MALRGRVAVTVATALVGAGCAGPAPVTAQATGGMSGTVVMPCGLDPTTVVVAVAELAGTRLAEAVPAADGSWSVPDVLAAGSYSVSVSQRTGFAGDAEIVTTYYGDVLRGSAPVDVGSGGATGITIHAIGGGRISGTLANTAGDWTALHPVSLDGRSYGEEFVKGDGRYLLKGLPPGDTKLFIRPDNTHSSPQSPTHQAPQWWPAVSEVDGPAAAAAITVTACRTVTDVDATLHPGATITGRVTAVDGTPGQGWVRAIDPRTPQASWDSLERTTDGGLLTARAGWAGPDGSYTIGGLTPGADYLVTARGDGSVSSILWPGTYAPATATPVNASTAVPRSGIDLDFRTPPFSDVTSQAPFFADIAWMVNKGITKGYPDGSYHPADPVSRAVVAEFLYRLDGSPAFSAPATSPFPDVPTSDPSYREICWLVARGITSGYPDGTYRPASPVAREEMAAFLYRLAGKPPAAPGTTAPFADVPTTHPFVTEIAWLASAGAATEWTEPQGPPTYRPALAITRDAAAAFMHRYDFTRHVVPTGT